MKRPVWNVGALVVVAAVTLAATAISEVTLSAQSPKGWRVRVDRSTSATDPDAAGAVKFVTQGSGFHATNPQAAVYWNPANTASGSYTLKATFTQLEMSDHTNYYGLVFGAKDLEGPQETYLYFMVAQDGTYLIKRREGDGTQIVAERMPSPAVKKLDANGRATNALEVHVMPQKVDYIVNGTTVHSAPRTGVSAMTDGIYGIRVNHRLNVQIDGLSVTK